MRRIRLFVFPERPDFLLVYVPEGETFTIGPITSPIDKAIVSNAMSATGLEYSTTESTPGRWTQRMSDAKKAERNERKQKQDLRMAEEIHALVASGDAHAKTRAEALVQKGIVDDELRALKSKMSDAKRVAFEQGKFLPRGEFLALERRIKALQAESLSLQTQLGRMREAEKAENIRQAESDAQLFRLAAKKLLTPEQIEEIEECIDAILEERQAKRSNAT